MSQTVLALIPARSGSKGIPDKNIRNVGGKPLLAWSIEQARASRSITRTIVSTDSSEYARIARDHGAETPFLRPAEISGDHSTDLDVFRHALGWLRDNEGDVPEICVHLRPTCPVREPGVIDEIVGILQSRTDLDSVRTVTEVLHPPYKMWRRGADGLLAPLLEVPGMAEPWNEPRQKLPSTFLQTASIDAVRTRVILEEGSMTGRRIFGYVEREFHDIDTPEELERAGRLLSSRTAMRPAPAASPSGEVKTFCFDIDGVIACKVPDNDYRKATPREEIIAKVRHLHAQGHRIVLCTARGSMTGIDWRSVTERQMAEWGVPYHELHFGKPAADYYVDDRALRDDELDQLPEVQ